MHTTSRAPRGLTARHNRRDENARRDRHRSRLRNDGEDVHPAQNDLQGRAVLFLRPRVSREVRREPGQISSSRVYGDKACRRRRNLHVPDASRGATRRGQARVRCAEWRSSPRMVTLDEGPNPELVDMTRRFAVALAFGAPVMAYAMWTMVSGESHLAPGVPDLAPRASSLANWLQLAAATPVVCYAGAPFFVRAWQSLVNRSPNMFTLIGDRRRRRVSATAPSRTVAPAVFPDGFRMHGVVDDVLRHGGRDHRARAARTGARDPRAQPDVRCADQGLASGLTPKTARKVIAADARTTSRSRTSASAIDCACVRAKKCRSTASVVEGRSVHRRIDGDGRADARRERSPAAA